MAPRNTPGSSTPVACSFCGTRGGGHTAGCPGAREPAERSDKLFDEVTTKRRDPLVGARVGEYQIERRIGVGGTGIVYEGIQPLIQRRVAIKVLRPELAQTAEQQRVLLAEARAANAIHHRGIINIFGFGEIPGIGPYLVMEFLEGSALSAVVEERGPLGQEETLALLVPILEALRAAHESRVIHRDLKPSNIFVVRESTGTHYTKLLDFGLAKQTRVEGNRPDSQLGMILGTPEYMSPEQATGQPISPQSDLYSLGVVMYEMLTRKLPASGRNPIAIISAKLTHPAPPVSALVPVHSMLSALISRMLSKDPRLRPASASVALAEINRIQRSLHDRPTLVDEPIPEFPLRRHPTPTDIEIERPPGLHLKPPPPKKPGGKRH